MADELTSWVALLRGVNVGGGNKVPMADLRQLAEGLGWRDVKSYIASGNLVFRAAPGDLAAVLGGAMQAQMGVDVPILVRSQAAFQDALAHCPYPRDAGKTVHGFFCFDVPVIDHVAYRGLAVPGEAVSVKGDLVWVHTPHGFGRSVLAGKIGRVITGTGFTARNLNTIHKLSEMLDG